MLYKAKTDFDCVAVGFSFLPVCEESLGHFRLVNKSHGDRVLNHTGTLKSEFINIQLYLSFHGLPWVEK